MKKFLHLLFLPFLILSFQSCKKTASENNPGNIILGEVSGRVVAANNVTPISHALVFVSTAQKLYSTYTDLDGRFSLMAASGTQQLYIQTGSGNMFRTIKTVVIPANDALVINESMRLNQVANLAYVTGTYDKIESIVRDSLGYSATMLQPTDLANLAVISNYDAIFLNCGIQSQYVNIGTDNALSNYVSAGGSLYASDWSVAFLMGASTTATCPVPKIGGFIADSLMCTRRNGYVQTIQNANLVSPELQYYLNKTSMDIVYNLGSWEKILSVNNNFWQTMVTDPTDNSSLLVRTNQYSNNNPPMFNIGATDSTHTTICHQMGAGVAPITITIDNADLPMHLAHGDNVGSCNNTNNAGWIYFTTFHNEPNGQISPDVRKILEFMILNL